MSRLIPDPLELDAVAAGLACSICWGTGKPFGDGDTPEKIQLNFSGINKAPDWLPGMEEPFEGLFELDQDAFAPCHFEFSSVDWQVDCTFESGNTEIILEGKIAGFQFLSPSANACQQLVFNERALRYENGSCKILIPEVA